FRKRSSGNINEFYLKFVFKRIINFDCQCIICIRNNRNASLSFEVINVYKTNITIKELSAFINEFYSIKNLVRKCCHFFIDVFIYVSRYFREISKVFFIKCSYKFVPLIFLFIIYVPLY